MMRFEKFKEIIDLNVKVTQRLDKAYNLGLELANFFDDYEKINSLLWEEILDSDGVDWINWFLYEKGYIHDGIGKEDLRAFDENKNEICQDLPSLYELLVEEGCFKCKS